MEKRINVLEKLAGMVIGFALMTVGFIFLVLGVTFLPLVGIVIALPVMFLSMHFLSPRMAMAPASEESEAPTETAEGYPVSTALHPRQAA